MMGWRGGIGKRTGSSEDGAGESESGDESGETHCD
jgi:hypothetical protein